MYSKLELFICMFVVFGITLTGTINYTYHPDLQSFCKGSPEVLLTLEGKGLSDGTLYMKCDGKLYQSSIEVITHQYDKSNNHVRIYGNSGEPVDSFEIDSINGGI